MSDHEPAGLLPIGRVVAELQRAHPDVTHSSLRFLEREGLLVPTRTPGGHRLYSRHDLDRIRQIKAWQAQRLSLDEIRRRLAALHALGFAGRGRRPVPGGGPGRRCWPRRRASSGTPTTLGMPLAQLLGNVLRPALVRGGRALGTGRPSGRPGKGDLGAGPGPRRRAVAAPRRSRPARTGRGRRLRRGGTPRARAPDGRGPAARARLAGPLPGGRRGSQLPPARPSSCGTRRWCSSRRPRRRACRTSKRRSPPCGRPV